MEICYRLCGMLILIAYQFFQRRAVDELIEQQKAIEYNERLCSNSSTEQLTNS